MRESQHDLPQRLHFSPGQHRFSTDLSSISLGLVAPIHGAQNDWSARRRLTKQLETMASCGREPLIIYDQQMAFLLPQNSKAFFRAGHLHDLNLLAAPAFEHCAKSQRLWFGNPYH